MKYPCMPNYPPPCAPRPSQPSYGGGCRESSMRFKLFGDCDSPCSRYDRPLPPAAPPVTIVNPWNCRETAQVTLSVDECGNLVVYIKR